MSRSRDPKTPAEWQEAVNAAEFMISIDSARQYGLIEGGPQVNADRCADLLERGRQRGYFPLPFEQLAKIYMEPPEETATPPASETAP